GSEQEAGGQHGFAEGPDVVGDHVVAPVGGRPGLGAAHQRQSAADGGSQGDLRGVPGGLGEAGDVTEHGGVHVHTGGEGGHIGHGTGGDHRGQGGGAVLHGGAGEDLHGGVLVRVAQGGAHQEPVQLGLREAVGTGLLDRVLGGEHDERRRDVVRLPVDGDASFFHHLQQRRLSLRRRAVDLIGEYHGGEDGAGVELEAL